MFRNRGLQIKAHRTHHVARGIPDAHGGWCGFAGKSSLAGRFYCVLSASLLRQLSQRESLWWLRPKGALASPLGEVPEGRRGFCEFAGRSVVEVRLCCLARQGCRALRLVRVLRRECEFAGRFSLAGRFYCRAGHDPPLRLSTNVFGFAGGWWLRNSWFYIHTEGS